MIQNAILNGLKFKNFPVRACFHTPAIGKYWILKFHDSTQDPFSPFSTECLQTPFIIIHLVLSRLEIVNEIPGMLYIFNYIATIYVVNQFTVASCVQILLAS